MHIILNYTLKKKKFIEIILLLVMALFQGFKKLFGPLLDDLDCVSAVKEAMELQVKACM
jgi:hypothetical protein